MTAAWPGTLPGYVLEQGYNERLPDQGLETPMEAGPPKKRRRFTTNWRPFQLTIKCLPAQVEAFETFYLDTLGGGTLPFTWLHPRTRAPGTFRFRNPPPSYTPQGEATIISFAVDQMA